jgi:hypothetical protein
MSNTIHFIFIIIALKKTLIIIKEIRIYIFNKVFNNSFYKKNKSFKYIIVILNFIIIKFKSINNNI